MRRLDINITSNVSFMQINVQIMIAQKLSHRQSVMSAFSGHTHRISLGRQAHRRPSICSEIYL